MNISPFFEKCKNPKACSIILRGAGKEILQEVERNLMDAMNITRNIFLNPSIVPGGGATEMSIACYLRKKSITIEGSAAFPYKAAANAFEVIPRTLANNCGADTIRLMTNFRAKHSTLSNSNIVINGNNGLLTNNDDLKIWEPFIVKESIIKTALEAACLLLRIDDIVSGITSEELENYLAGN